MSRWLSACLAAGLLFAPAATADEPVAPPKEKPPVVEPPRPIPPVPPPAPTPLAVGCGACGTISLPRYYLQEVQSATTLPRMVLREELVGAQPGGPVLDYIEQRQTITVVEMKAHPVEQEVTCMTSQPVTTVDSCGKPCVTYQQVPVTKKVTITVFEPVNVQKDVIVRVPVLKPGKDLLVRRLAVDEITIPAIESRFNLISVPNELSVPVAPPPCLGK